MDHLDPDLAVGRLHETRAVEGVRTRGEEPVRLAELRVGEGDHRSGGPRSRLDRRGGADPSGGATAPAGKASFNPGRIKLVAFSLLTASRSGSLTLYSSAMPARKSLR